MKSKMEGFGWYTYETLSRMVKNHPEHQFIFLFDRPFDRDFIFASNVEAYSVGLPARHPLLFHLWYDYAVTRALRKHKADIFLSPDGYLSKRTLVPSIAVIHDLNFEHYPDDLPRKFLRYYKKNFPEFARIAKRIVTVSEFSKNDIAKLYQVDPQKIEVSYNGAADSLHPLKADEVASIRMRITGGKPYFVFVGALTPRKNLARLFEAYDLYRSRSSTDFPLVIVGEKYFWNEAIRNSFEGMKFQKDVVFTGHLKRDELNEVLGAALALLYVSYFEGFGIPLVEAMYCDVPVLTSDKTSLPEVAGDAALLCDPFSVESITSGIKKMAENENLRTELMAKGRERRKKFSWDTTSEILWNAIVKVAHAEGKI